MPYVIRDARGHAVGVVHMAPGHTLEWLDEGHPDLTGLPGEAEPGRPGGGYAELAETDLGLARVVEDLIDLLVERNLLRFTDFPEAAQAKLLARRRLRVSLNALNLLEESDPKVNLP